MTTAIRAIRNTDYYGCLTICTFLAADLTDEDNANALAHNLAHAAARRRVLWRRIPA
jgi:hypothetical protein